MNNVKKRFRTCYIVDVALGDEAVVLEDSAHNEFYFPRDDKDAAESFKTWFCDFFLKGIPQCLTIIEYSIIDTPDGLSKMRISKIFANPNVYGINDNEMNASKDE